MVAARSRARSSVAMRVNVPVGTSAHLEHRVARSDAPKLGVGRVGADALEELADLPLPPAQVGAQHVDLGIVGDLDRGERLDPAADAQLTRSGGAEVANPLGLAAGRHEVAAAVVDEEVD